LEGEGVKKVIFSLDDQINHQQKSSIRKGQGLKIKDPESWTENWGKRPSVDDLDFL